MPDQNAQYIAKVIAAKTREVKWRADMLMEPKLSEGEIEFLSAMLRDAASGLAFWVGELEKAVRK